MPFNVFRLPPRLRRRARRSRLATMIVLLAAICFILSPLYFIYKPPSILIRHFQHRWPDVLWQVDTASKVIALSIDDVPSEYTDEIRQILKDNDAHATFFVIGSQVAGREAALKQLILDGNELGNHAMRDEASRDLSDATLAEQIHTVEEMIQKAYVAVNAPMPPKYFRPGSGFFNDRMRKMLANLDYRLVLGSIYPHDPQIPYWRINASHILSMLRPGGIIICHDRRAWTVPMLRMIIPEIRKRGYRIVTISGLLKEAKT